MKIIIIGSKGMLGTDCVTTLIKAGHQVVAHDVATIDITDSGSIQNALENNKEANFLINCAAYTNVDACETENELAYQVNVIGPKNLALFCKENNIVFVHFSTDYVFDGKKLTPYVESDPTGPLGYYGQTKADSEKCIQSICDRYYIFRIQWLYGHNGKNFVNTILNAAKERDELSIVTDQIGSPTWAVEVARCLLAFIEHLPAFGIYHLRSDEIVSWYDFAQYFLQEENIDCKLLKTTADKFPRLAKRPENSIMSISKLLALNIYSPLSWKKSVKLYLKSTALS
jgi:dTDP-4-dehydrorhamnose reductase